MDRRGFLKMVAAGSAAGAMLARPRWLFAQSGRAPKVLGKGAIKITSVKTHDTGRLIVEVTTDAGLTGWGEVNIVPSRLADAVVKEFRPLLVGADATAIEQVWQMLYRAHRNVRGGSIHLAAIGGIDIALWDILGQAAKMPVHRLLGGPCRESILHYPSKTAWKQTTHTLHEMVETPGDLDRAADAVAQARQRVGSNGHLMFDGHGKFTATAAIQLCKKLEKYDLLYFEEVVPPENNADLARVARSTTVPLACGERMGGIWAFREVLEAGSCSVLNPDVVSVGGISQMHKLAGIAEMYDLPLAPHGTHSAIGTAASLHVDAAINNFLIQECYQHIVAGAKYATGVTWSDSGRLPLPGGPGLGVKIDREALAEAVAKKSEKGHRGIDKAYFLPDGSVGDR